MPAAQIYSVVNKIAKNIGYTGTDVVDLSSFVKFGQDAFSDPMLTEGVYNQMYDLVGRTVISIDEAEDEGRGIVVDAFEYGSILQKLSFKLQEAETSSEWDIEHPENPYLEVRKEGVVQKFFEQYIPTFSWKDVAYDTQLKEAFRGPESLQGFIDALYTRMRNAYKLAKQGLSDAAIGGIMASIYNDATAATPGVNAARRVRHLLTEYNTNINQGTDLTAADSLQNSDYLDWIRKQFIIDKLNLNKMNKLYNDGSVERRTTEADLKFDLSVAVTASYAKYWGDTFNESYVKLPKHTEVVNWGIATQPQTIKVSLDGEATTTITNIIGFMYDKDAIVATMDRDRFVSMYDQWNDRNVFKLTANRRYVADPSENGIIYLND